MCDRYITKKWLTHGTIVYYEPLDAAVSRPTPGQTLGA